MVKIRQNSSSIVFFTFLSALLSLALFLNMKHNQKVAKEGVFVRNYHPEDLTFVRAFISKEEGDLRYYNNVLYTNDIYTSQIVAFDTLGNLKKKYGRKKEDNLSSIIGWHVDETGIHTADHKRKIFEHLSFENELLLEYKTEKLIYGATKLTGNRYMITTPKVSESNPGEKFKLMFVAIDTDSQRAEALNNPFPNIEFSSVKFSGHYIKNALDQIFYVCKMAGFFFSINKEGKIKYFTETIDKTPTPKLVTSEVGIRYDPLAPAVNLSLSVDNDYLYILSNLKSLFEDEQNSRSIDVYNVKDGSYEYSIKVPNFNGITAQKIAISLNGDFYIRYGENIAYYQFEKSVPRTYLLNSIYH